MENNNSDSFPNLKAITPTNGYTSLKISEKWYVKKNRCQEMGGL